MAVGVPLGHLETRSALAPADRGAVGVAALADDVYRTVPGDERGERLVVHRRDAGSARQHNWASYRFTREPLGFADTLD